MNIDNPPSSNSEKLFRDKIEASSNFIREAIKSGFWWHSIDLGDGNVTPGVHSQEDLQLHLRRLQLPDDLSDKRVLDIGCWDGYYSFEMERRGAQVVSVDCFRPENYFKAHAALNSKAEFKELSVYEINKRSVGTYDIVLFRGVLYHLRHPLLGLERVCEVTKDYAIVESHICDNFFSSPRPVMEFYEIEELGGQYDNWWGPSRECLIQMIRAAGFARVEPLESEPVRAAFKAYRNFEVNPNLESSPSIEVSAAFNPITWKPEIPVRGRNAFLQLYAKGLPESVTRETLRVHVGDFGINPHFLGESEYPGWKQVSVPVPPGLDPGSAMVWIACGNQRSSEVEAKLVEGTEW